MWFLRKARISELEQVRLRQILSDLRFKFTSLPSFSSRALVYNKVWGNYIISDNSFPIFNGIFAVDPLIKPSEVKSLIEDYRKIKNEGILCISNNAVDFSEKIKVIDEMNCQLLSEDYDLAVDLSTFKVPFFFKNSVKLIEVQSEKEIEEWVNLFITNFSLEPKAFDYLSEMIRMRSSYIECPFKFFLASRKNENIGTVVIGTYQDVTAGFGLSISKKYRSIGSGTMIMASIVNYVKSAKGRFLIGYSNKAGYQVYRKAPSLVHLSKSQVYNLDIANK